MGSQGFTPIAVMNRVRTPHYAIQSRAQVTHWSLLRISVILAARGDLC